MTAKKTREVWAGPGVLSMGRRKIAVGDPIPEELESKARKSLRASGKIVDEVVKPEDEPVDLVVVALAASDAADAAEELAKDAVYGTGELAKIVGDAKKATSTAKALNAKAKNAAKADNASNDVKQAAIDADKAYKDAKADFERLTAELPDVEALKENAVRLRMEADKAAAAVEAAE